MGKVSELGKVLANLKAEQDAINHAIAKIEAQIAARPVKVAQPRLVESA
jgi:hypothetical protein